MNVAVLPYQEKNLGFKYVSYAMMPHEGRAYLLSKPTQNTPRAQQLASWFYPVVRATPLPYHPLTPYTTPPLWQVSGFMHCPCPLALTVV